MILELDLSTGTGPFTEKEKVALENLATGYREGNFILSGDRSALEVLRKSAFLRPSSRAAYENAFAKLPESLGLAARFGRRFRIAKGEAVTQSATSDNCAPNTKVHYFPLHDFEKTISIQKVMLLTEGNDDCNLYEKLLRCALRAEGLYGVKYAFDGHAFGGSNLVFEVEKLRKGNDRFFFAFLDSDLDWTGGKLGDTARKALAAYGGPTPWGICYVLPVREIENLAPLKLAKMYGFAKANDVSEILDFASEPPRETWKYIDLKEGLRVRKFTNMPKQASERVCIEEFCKKKSRTITSYCLCGCSGEEKCQCLILEGFGCQVPDRFEQFLDTVVQGDKITNHYKPEQWALVRGIAMEVISWACRRDPLHV